MTALMRCEERLHVLPGWEEVFLLPWVEERGLHTAEPHSGEPLWQGKPVKHSSLSAANSSWPPLL